MSTKGNNAICETLNETQKVYVSPSGKERKGDIMKLRDKILYMSYGAGLVVLVVYMVMEVMVVVLFY